MENTGYLNLNTNLEKVLKQLNYLIKENTLNNETDEEKRQEARTNYLNFEKKIESEISSLKNEINVIVNNKLSEDENKSEIEIENDKATANNYENENANEKEKEKDNSSNIQIPVTVNNEDKDVNHNICNKIDIQDNNINNKEEENSDISSFDEIMIKADIEFESNNNKSKSLELYYKAFKKNATDVKLNYRLGEVLEDMHEYDKAAIYFKNANELSKLNTDPYHMYAEVVKHRVLKKKLIFTELDEIYKEALRRYEKAIGSNHNLDSKIYMYQGVCNIHFKKYEDALISLTKSIELNSSNYKAYYYKGNVYFKLNKFEEAKKCYMQSINIYPEYAYTFNNLGCISLLEKKYDEAIIFYEQALDIYPLFTNSMTNIGLALKEQGNFTEAINWFLKTLKINNYDYVAMYNYGYSLKENGNESEAEKCLDEARNF